MNFSRRTSRHEDLRIDLTSLIDVVFLLIIFFMVTTTFQAKSGISVKLPEAESRISATKAARVIVSIQADGVMFLGDKKVDPNTMEKDFAEIADKNPNTLVVVRADRAVAHGTVVNVMDAARVAGLTNLAIATVIRQPE